MKRWFPRPSAWLSAVALTVFAGLLGTTMSWLYGAGASMLFNAPRVSAVFFFLGFTSPIFLIAFGNHAMHRIMDAMAKRSSSRGFMPGLMSWWAGLYGWLVLMLAAWTSVMLVMMVHPESTFYAFANVFRIDSGLTSMLSIPTFVFIGLGAFLFQVEARVKDKIAAGPDSTT